MKIIVAGSRDFSDYELLCRTCADIQITDEIVSGCAEGADKLGEEFARVKGISVKRFKADWKTYGKSAGPIRNMMMAKYADKLIVFWDGASRGTKNMIDTAKKEGLEVRVIQYTK